VVVVAVLVVVTVVVEALAQAVLVVQRMVQATAQQTHPAQPQIRAAALVATEHLVAVLVHLVVRALSSCVTQIPRKTCSLLVLD
jgi:hypothetical protein